MGIKVIGSDSTLASALALAFFYIISNRTPATSSAFGLEK